MPDIETKQPLETHGWSWLPVVQVGLIIALVGGMVWLSARDTQEATKERVNNELLTQKTASAEAEPLVDHELADLDQLVNYHVADNCAKESEAAKAFLEKYPKSGFHSEVHRLYGYASYCLENYPLALSELELSVQLEPDNLDQFYAYQYLANLYCFEFAYPEGSDVPSLEKLQTGLRHALKSVEMVNAQTDLPPADTAYSYLSAGTCYYQMSKPRDARLYINKALELGPAVAQLELFRDILKELKITHSPSPSPLRAPTSTRPF